MKAFILAAGNGTRLRPLTETLPKCLVPIRGVPMLQIWLDICRRYGIDEVTVNLHSHAGVVRDFLRRCPSPVRVRLFEEETLLGSAGTLRANREWIAEDECFWVFYGDVLTTADLAEMMSFHRTSAKLATLGLYRVSNPQSCGIATVAERGVIRDFVEKPQTPAGNLAFSGLMIATSAVLDLIPPACPADIGFHLLPKLVGRMAGYTISGYVADIGNIEAYAAAQKNWPVQDLEIKPDPNPEYIYNHSAPDNFEKKSS